MGENQHGWARRMKEIDLTGKVGVGDGGVGIQCDSKHCILMGH